MIAKIRSNILTEGNIRDLVKVVAEEMDGVIRECQSQEAGDHRG